MIIALFRFYNSQVIKYLYIIARGLILKLFEVRDQWSPPKYYFGQA